MLTIHTLYKCVHTVHTLYRGVCPARTLYRGVCTAHTYTVQMCMYCTYTVQRCVYCTYTVQRCTYCICTVQMCTQYICIQYALLLTILELVVVGPSARTARNTGSIAHVVAGHRVPYTGLEVDRGTSQEEELDGSQEGGVHS